MENVDKSQFYKEEDGWQPGNPNPIMDFVKKNWKYLLLIIFSIITVIFIIIIGIVSFQPVHNPNMSKTCQGELNKLRACISSYKDVNNVCIVYGLDKSGNPLVTNAEDPENYEIMKALTKPNKNDFRIMAPISSQRMDMKGNYLDPWLSPFIFKTIGKRDSKNKWVITDIYVFSAGKDGVEAISSSGQWDEKTTLPPNPIIPEDNDNVYPSE
jgi:hypothetical protein